MRDVSQAHLRHARYFCQVLKSANTLYLEGGASIAAALTLFDLEAANIVAGRTLARSLAETRADTEAAQLCCEYPDAGMHIIDLRLPARERLQWFADALDSARQLKDRYAEGMRLGTVAMLHDDLGDTHLALTHLEQSLTIIREFGDRAAEAATLFKMGVAWSHLGDPRAGIGHLEQSLAIAREVGNRAGESASLCSLGLAHMELGALDLAAQYLEHSISLADAIGDRRSKSASLHNLGIIHRKLAQPELALQCFAECLEIAREIGDRRNEGAILASLGTTYSDLNDIPRAIECYEQALAIARDTEDPRGVGKMLFNLSLVLGKASDFDRAIAAAEESLRIHATSADPACDAVRRLLDSLRDEAQRRKMDRLTETALATAWIDPARAHGRDTPSNDEVVILLVRGEDPTGQPIYAYVAVRHTRLPEFMAAQRAGEFFPEDFGVIIESGSGEPTRETQQRMESEYGFSHVAMIDLS